MPDFEAIKARVSIRDAMQILNLSMKEGPQSQFRGKCPTCNSGGDRALAINLTKGFWCFAAKTGGDVISLVAHIRSCSVKEAAEWLEPKEQRPKQAPKFKVETDPEHMAVIASGIDPAIAARAGLGYTEAGVLKGTIAVPVYDKDTHELIGYLGCIDFIVPPSLRGANVVELNRDAG